MEGRQHIIISHVSARRLWKHAGAPGCPVPSVAKHLNLEDAVVTKEACERVRTVARSWLQEAEFDVLVGGRKAWRDLNGVHVRTASCVAARSFCCVDDAVFVASPELSYLQMATLLTPGQLVAYGMELCSSYAIDPQSGEIVEDVPAHTTPQALHDYLQNSKGVRGCSSALRALQWVLPGAESPMEVKLATVLCLPRRFGGYGLPLPQLNREIRPGRSSHTVSQAKYRPDIGWLEEKVAVEYDGKESHQDAHFDKRRINDLESLGWKVFAVTSSDIYNAEGLNKMAAKVAKCLGVRLRRSTSWVEENRRLREDLGLNWKELPRVRGFERC